MRIRKPPWLLWSRKDDGLRANLAPILNRARSPRAGGTRGWVVPTVSKEEPLESRGPPPPGGGPRCTFCGALRDEFLLGLSVQVREPLSSRPSRVGQELDVQAAPPVAHVDESVVPVGRPGAATAKRLLDIDVADLAWAGGVGEVDHRGPAEVPRRYQDVPVPHGDDVVVVHGADLVSLGPGDHERGQGLPGGHVVEPGPTDRARRVGAPGAEAALELVAEDRHIPVIAERARVVDVHVGLVDPVQDNRAERIGDVPDLALFQAGRRGQLRLYEHTDVVAASVARSATEVRER